MPDIPEINFTLTAGESVSRPVDATLSIAGMAADAKAVGDALAGVDSTTDALEAGVAGKVAKTGDTMTGNLNLSGKEVHVRKASPDMDMAANPSASTYNYGTIFTDAENRPVGQIDVAQHANGQTSLRLLIYGYDLAGERTVTGGINIYASRDGQISYSVTNPENLRNALGLGNTSGPVPVANGGSGLSASPSLLVNLASAAAASVMQASPRPGVTGVLGTANGGTGSANPTTGLSNLGGVAKAGDTMTGNLTLADGAALIKKSTTADVTANPAEAVYYSGVVTSDKNNRPITQIDSVRHPTGQNGLRLLAHGYDTEGNRVAAKGIYINVGRDGAANYAISDVANFRSALGIRHATLTLSFAEATTGAYADYNFGAGVQVLAASVVGSRTYQLTAFARTAPGSFNTWSFILGSTAAVNGLSVDVSYIII